MEFTIESLEEIAPKHPGPIPTCSSKPAKAYIAVAV